MKTSRTALSAIFSSIALGATCAQAATIAGVSYSYVASGLEIQGGKDGSTIGVSATQALTDGAGLSGIYTPAAAFWGAGEEGSIYNQNDTDIINGDGQPTAAFDLGDDYNLSTIEIHYGVQNASGVNAPTEVIITVDGNLIGSFTGFDNTTVTTGGGAIRMLSVPFTGVSGQNVTLQVVGNTDKTGWGSPGATNSWLGLTEIQFDGTLVPEPSSGLLAGLGALALCVRRRRR